MIERLQVEASKVLDPLIPVGASVALLDFPNHSNVGDSLIWLGEIAYLRRRQAKIRYVCEPWSLVVGHLRRRLTPETVILIHGGGNFGTLWPEHHAFRLNVIRQFPDHRILQLPQSLYFSQDADGAATARATAEVLERHRGFTLLVRDETSAGIAERRLESLPPVVPDMAFFIGPVAGRTTPGNDFFLLSRSDHEKDRRWNDTQARTELLARAEQRDWLKSGLGEMVVRRLSRTLGVRGGGLGTAGVALTLAVWNAMAGAELRRGADLLGQGRVVVTDRLHAHILSILLDKPHVVVDNANGKLSGFMDTWTGNCANTHRAGDLGEALEIAERLVT